MSSAREKILLAKEMVAPKTKLMNAEVVPEKTDDEASAPASNALKHPDFSFAKNPRESQRGRPWCQRRWSSSMDRTRCCWYKRGAACVSDVVSDKQSQTASPSRQLCAKCASYMSLCSHQRYGAPSRPLPLEADRHGAMRPDVEDGRHVLIRGHGSVVGARH